MVETTTSNGAVTRFTDAASTNAQAASCAVSSGPGEDGGDVALCIDGHIDGEVWRREGHGGADEIVHRVPSPGDEGGRGIGDAAGVVRLQDRLGRGQARAHGLGAAAEAGEEMGLDESGDDAYVGLDVLALQQDRGPVDLADRDVRIAPGIVVDDGVAGDDVGADELLHLRRRRLAVRPRGAEQGDGGVGNPAVLRAARAEAGARSGWASAA